MAFYILANSTTADADDVMDNFYYVAQGSRLPMGGASLEATTTVYNLGATATVWNNLFCNNIYANSITSTDKTSWRLISESTLVNTATEIEFTGLNGDAQLDYMFLGIVYHAAILTCNDIAAGQYGNQYLRANSTTVEADRAINQAAFNLVPADEATNTSFFVGFLNAKTGMMRMCNCMAAITASLTSVYRVSQIAGVWNDSTTTITSLQFISAHLEPGSSVQLWGRT